MPPTAVELLPLPSLKAYASGSAVVLSLAAYYAASATGEADWRSAWLGEPPEPEPKPRDRTQHTIDVIVFMLQEPICTWTMVNAWVCAVWCATLALRRAALGRLRAHEAGRARRALAAHAFHRAVLCAALCPPRAAAAAVAALAALAALGHLAAAALHRQETDRGGGGGGARRAGALAAAAGAGAALLLRPAHALVLPHSTDTFALLVAESLVVMAASGQTLVRLLVRPRRARHMLDLALDCTGACVETCALGGGAARAGDSAPLAALLLLLQLRRRLAAVRARLGAAASLARAREMVKNNFPEAGAAALRADDACAICWEPLRRARVLPCDHLFHDGCLSRWLQQHASCPSCRRALPACPPAAAPRAPAHNHLFHFDSSRYVSWLPSFSVEVTRGRRDLDDDAQVEFLTPLPALVPVPPAADFPAAVPTTAPPSPARPAPPPPASDAPAAEDDSWMRVSQVRSEFADAAGERQALLERRKRTLLAHARRRYLHAHGPGPAPGAPS